jgi:hypothetical protein
MVKRRVINRLMGSIYAIGSIRVGILGTHELNFENSNMIKIKDVTNQNYILFNIVSYSKQNWYFDYNPAWIRYSELYFVPVRTKIIKNEF